MEDSETFSKLNSFTFPQTVSSGQQSLASKPRNSEIEVDGSQSDSDDEVELLDQPPRFPAEFHPAVPVELSPKSTIHTPSRYQPSNPKRLLNEPLLSSPTSLSTSSYSHPNIPYPHRRHSNIIATQKRRNSKQLSISSLSPVTMSDRTFGKTQEYITGSSSNNNYDNIHNNENSDKVSETLVLNPPLLKRTSSSSMKSPSHRRSLSISSNPISVDSLTTPLGTINSGLSESNLSYATSDFQPKPLEFENHQHASHASKHTAPDSYPGRKTNDDDCNPSFSMDYFDDESTRIMKTPSSGSSYTVGEAETLDLRRPSVVYIVSSPTNLEVDLNVIKN